MALRFDSVPPLRLFMHMSQDASRPRRPTRKVCLAPLTEEETEVQSGNKIRLRSHSEYVAKLGFALRSVVICGL